MRTNIDIDDELMRRAMAATGKTTKKEVVTAALETLIRTHERVANIRALRGKGDFWPEVIEDREKYDIED